MRLKRHYFVSDDLDDLESFEVELENADIVTPQIHVLTVDETDAANHTHLHEVTPFMKTDVVHSAMLGALVGLTLAAFVLALTYLAGWHETRAGWLPFVYLSILLLGFFTWQGGLWGIESPNAHFRDFERMLKEGRHLFFVDLEPGRGKVVRRLARKHPGIQAAGVGVGAPHWIVSWQYRLRHFFTETFP
ncbi:MAG: NAD/FAD-utilizing enzyme [Wenzhouxiangellaceae bacterium]|nr:NAD/FAD-utilizing enzyme [Wenzhouxiangellaceae bacterium]